MADNQERERLRHELEEARVKILELTARLEVQRSARPSELSMHGVKAEHDAGHTALDEAGIPRQAGDITLGLYGRIDLLRKELARDLGVSLELQGKLESQAEALIDRLAQAEAERDGARQQLAVQRSARPSELLNMLNSDDRGEIAIAASVQGNKLRIDFGKTIDWIALDKAHLDAFIGVLVAMGKELT